MGAVLAFLLTGCAGGGESVSSPAVLHRASSSPVVSVEPWTFESQPGQLIRTPSYRLYTTEREAFLLERLPRFQEAALDHYTSFFGALPRPTATLDTFLMATRSQWTSLTRQLMGRQAATYLRIPRGGYSAGGRAVLYDIGPYDTLAIAAHEGWHQYTQRTFKEGLPVWMEEGAAVLMEGFRWDPERIGSPVFLPWANLERFDQLRQAARRGRLMSLGELLDSTPQELLGVTDDGTLTYYAQVWALGHFLWDGAGGRYRGAMHEMLAEAAGGRMGRRMEAVLGRRRTQIAMSGRRGRAAFVVYFNRDLSEAAREYDEFVQTLVHTGARDRVTVGESPIEGGR